MSKQKAQSATEYLVTYGWMLLIVAIILSVLIYFGVFEKTGGVRALPGSCSIDRPFGPYSNVAASVVGICTTEPPLTVDNVEGAIANFNPGGGKGGGGSSYPIYISLGGTGWATPFISTRSFTITMWIYYTGTTVSHCEGLFGEVPEPGSGFEIYGYGGNNGACGPLWVNGTYIKWPKNSGNQYALNKWIFLAGVYNWTTGVATMYTNATVFGTVTIPARSFNLSGSIMIGADQWSNGDIYPFNGMLSNVQFYSTALSQNEISSLWNQGIGGPPINYQNLVGWWPLNTNTQDYSGNGNNATAYNISFYGAYPVP